MNTKCAQAGPGRGTATGKLRRSQKYHQRGRKSTAFRKIIPGRPDRRPPQAPVNSIDQARSEWLSRAGDVLSAFVVNLDGKHLSQSERREGWRVFESLLSAYVSRKRSLSREAAA